MPPRAQHMTAGAQASRRCRFQARSRRCRDETGQSRRRRPWPKTSLFRGSGGPISKVAVSSPGDPPGPPQHGMPPPVLRDHRDRRISDGCSRCEPLPASEISLAIASISVRPAAKAAIFKRLRAGSSCPVSPRDCPADQPCRHAYEASLCAQPARAARPARSQGALVAILPGGPRPLIAPIPLSKRGLL